MLTAQEKQNLLSRVRLAQEVLFDAERMIGDIVLPQKDKAARNRLAGALSALESLDDYLSAIEDTIAGANT